MSVRVDISKLVDQIESHADLQFFVLTLLADLREHPQSWENDSLERFLTAMAAWMADLDGYYANRGESFPADATWQVFGQILFAAKLYE